MSPTLKMFADHATTSEITIRRDHRPFKEAILPHLLGYSLTERETYVLGGQNEVNYYGIDWPYYFDKHNKVLDAPELIRMHLVGWLKNYKNYVHVHNTFVWNDMQVTLDIPSNARLVRGRFYRFDLVRDSEPTWWLPIEQSYEQPLRKRVEHFMGIDSVLYADNQLPGSVTIEELVEIDAATRLEVARRR